MKDELLQGDWSQHYTQSYYSDYNTAGYDAYLSKSIDVQGRVAVDPTTVNLSTMGQYQGNKMINFDASGVSGSLGDIIRIGSINLDGRRGRVSIYDEYGNEAIILGDLDG